jgi:hypothetical protein
MSDQPRACWCVANDKETCTCDVPFIGNFTEADRRVAAGTLRSLDMADVKAAVMADARQGDRRLVAPVVAPATVEIITSRD